MNCPNTEGDWLGLALGLARFGVWCLALGAQIHRAIGLGLVLGLVRFGSVWLGLGRSIGTAEISDWLGLALGLAIWFGQSIDRSGRIVMVTVLFPQKLVQWFLKKLLAQGRGAN